MRKLQILILLSFFVCMNSLVCMNTASGSIVSAARQPVKGQLFYKNASLFRESYDTSTPPNFDLNQSSTIYTKHPQFRPPVRGQGQLLLENGPSNQLIVSDSPGSNSENIPTPHINPLQVKFGQQRSQFANEYLSNDVSSQVAVAPVVNHPQQVNSPQQPSPFANEYLQDDALVNKSQHNAQNTRMNGLAAARLVKSSPINSDKGSIDTQNSQELPLSGKQDEQNPLKKGFLVALKDYFTPKASTAPVPQKASKAPTQDKSQDPNTTPADPVQRAVQTVRVTPEAIQAKLAPGWNLPGIKERYKGKSIENDVAEFKNNEDFANLPDEVLMTLAVAKMNRHPLHFRDDLDWKYDISDYNTLNNGLKLFNKDFQSTDSIPESTLQALKNEFPSVPDAMLKVYAKFCIKNHIKFTQSNKIGDKKVEVIIDPEWPTEEKNPENFKPTDQQKMYKTLKVLDSSNEKYLDQYKQADENVYDRLGNYRNLIDAVGEKQQNISAGLVNKGTLGFISVKDRKLTSTDTEGTISIKDYYNRRYGQNTEETFVALSQDIEALELKMNQTTDKTLQSNLNVLLQDAKAVKTEINNQMVAERVDRFMNNEPWTSKSIADATKSINSIPNRNKFLQSQDDAVFEKVKSDLEEIQLAVLNEEAPNGTVTIKNDLGNVENVTKRHIPSEKSINDAIKEVQIELKKLEEEQEKSKRNGMTKENSLNISKKILLKQNMLRQLKNDLNLQADADSTIKNRVDPLLEDPGIKTLTEELLLSKINKQIDIDQIQKDLVARILEMIEQDKTINKTKELDALINEKNRLKKSVRASKNQAIEKFDAIENELNILTEIQDADGNLDVYLKRVEKFKVYQDLIAKLKTKIDEAGEQFTRASEITNFADATGETLLRFAKEKLIGSTVVQRAHEINQNLDQNLLKIENNIMALENSNPIILENKSLNSVASVQDIAKYKRLVDPKAVEAGVDGYIDGELVGVTRKELLDLYGQTVKKIMIEYNKNAAKIKYYDAAKREIEQLWPDGTILPSGNQDPVAGAFAKLLTEFDAKQNTAIVNKITLLQDGYNENAILGKIKDISRSIEGEIDNNLQNTTLTPQQLNALSVSKEVFDQLYMRIEKSHNNKNTADLSVKELLRADTTKPNKYTDPLANIKKLNAFKQSIKDASSENLKALIDTFSEETGVEFSGDKNQILETIDYMLIKLTKTVNDGVKDSSIGQAAHGIANAAGAVGTFVGNLFGYKSDSQPVNDSNPVLKNVSPLDRKIYYALDAGCKARNIFLSNLTPQNVVNLLLLISGLSAVLLNIQNDSNLTDEQKQKAKNEATSAFLADVGNLYISNMTGADIDVIAATGIMSGSTKSIGSDAETLAISAGFNQLIQSLVPENSQPSYSYNNSPISAGNYTTNLDKFKANYIQNQLAVPLNQGSYQNDKNISGGYVPVSSSTSPSYYLSNPDSVSSATYPSFDEIMAL